MPSPTDSLRPVSGTADGILALLREWDAATDPAPLVVATSGSTGRPKRVVLSRDAVRASALATQERLGGPGQWVLGLPPTYVAGVQVLYRSVVAGTAPVAVAGAAGSACGLGDALAGACVGTCLVGSGWTRSAKNVGFTPIASAASSGLSARRGTAESSGTMAKRGVLTPSPVLGWRASCRGAFARSRSSRSTPSSAGGLAPRQPDGNEHGKPGGYSGTWRYPLRSWLRV